MPLLFFVVAMLCYMVGQCLMGVVFIKTWLFVWSWLKAKVEDGRTLIVGTFLGTTFATSLGIIFWPWYCPKIEGFAEKEPDEIQSERLAKAAKWTKRAGIVFTIALVSYVLFYVSAFVSGSNALNNTKKVVNAVKTVSEISDYASLSEAAGSSKNSLECSHNGAGASNIGGNYSNESPVQQYLALAEKGDMNAQFQIGYSYYHGEGVDKNRGEAFVWLKKAAIQGHAEAQNLVGNCYFDGSGVNKDIPAAVKWFKKSAEQGNSTAQNSMGYCYNNGRGVPESPELAVKWFRKAAHQGSACGYFNLGTCYERGRGVPKNKAEAVKCYQEAARQDHQDAIRCLHRLQGG